MIVNLSIVSLDLPTTKQLWSLWFYGRLVCFGRLFVLRYFVVVACFLGRLHGKTKTTRTFR